MESAVEAAESPLDDEDFAKAAAELWAWYLGWSRRPPHDEHRAADTAGRHVLTGTLFRRRSSRALLTEQPPPPKPEPVRRPAKVAPVLALAHHLQGAIDGGLVADHTAVARKLGLTRARVTQLLDVLLPALLAPDLQTRVVELDAFDGAEPMAGRTLRAVAHAGGATRAASLRPWSAAPHRK